MKRMGAALGMAALWCACLSASLWVAIELLATFAPPAAPTDLHGTGFTMLRDSQRLLHLSGEPYALGVYNSKLTVPLMRAQEDTLLDLLFGFARGPARAMAIRQLSLFYLMGLDRHLTEAERLEILGLAQGAPDPFPDLGPRYTRLAAYHAIHELSQRYATDMPRLACSLLALGADATADGHALLARNFDFEGGEVFDRDKLVLAVQPSAGFGFVSVAWAGMAGVVSGINEHGLVVTMNAGASREYRRVGAPTTLLVRRALEQARTIDEAVAIMTAAPRFVTDIMGLADATGRVAVLELLPESYALRTGSRLGAANHLLAPDFANDGVNLAQKQRTTTVARQARLDQLLESQPNGWTIERLLAAMRDRAQATGKLLPLGHRHALDALIATHSVLFDATAKRIYVSEGPHTLGAYLGYDVVKLVHARNADEVAQAYLPNLPADPLLPRYPQLRRARMAWSEARQALDRGDLVQATGALANTGSMADHPVTLRLKAELAAARNELAETRHLVTQALAATPEYAVETEALQRLAIEVERATSANPAP